MTGCDLCGVGPEDDCADDCPSRYDRRGETMDGIEELEWWQSQAWPKDLGVPDSLRDAWYFLTCKGLGVRPSQVMPEDLGGNVAGLVVRFAHVEPILVTNARSSHSPDGSDMVYPDGSSMVAVSWESSEDEPIIVRPWDAAQIVRGMVESIGQL